MTFESISEVVVKWQKDIDNAILGEIKRKAIDNGIKTEYVLNEKNIISALEKQIPKKPILLRFSAYRTFACVCNSRIKKGENYCRYCGQALDWSDTK